MNNEAKTRKLLIAVAAVLALVVIGLLVVVIRGGKKDTKEAEATTAQTEAVAESTTAEETTEAEKTEEQKKEEKTTEAKKAEEGDITISVAYTNGWESNGKHCGQFDAKVYNKSGENLSDWSIELTVPDGTGIESSWNGTFKLDKTKLTITAVDYNKEIAAGGTLGDIGFILNSGSEEELKEIAKSAKVLIAGKAYTASSGSTSSDKKEKSDEKKTEEKKTTEAAKEKPAAESGTPLENHGALSVKGTDIVDKNGKKFQLKGVSTHGLAWFPDYVNKDAFTTFRDDWDVNLVRLAMYTDEGGGYCTDGDKEKMKSLVSKGVDIATELGMYVIIDWHILHDLTPQKYKSEALDFFEEMSGKYKDYDNVIYEICNEPNGGTSWSEVKSYAEEVIPVIRANDKDAIIIIGTPTWSQDVDIAAGDPVKEDNLMYAVHFYASTHKDDIRNKVKTAHDKGLPIFVSEFSLCEASGDGAINYDETEKWFDLISELNLSYATWNISNKNETSSLISASCSKTSGWSEDELSEAGKWLRNYMREH